MSRRSVFGEHSRTFEDDDDGGRSEDEQSLSDEEPLSLPEEPADHSSDQDYSLSHGSADESDSSCSSDNEGDDESPEDAPADEDSECDFRELNASAEEPATRGVRVGRGARGRGRGRGRARNPIPRNAGDEEVVREDMVDGQVVRSMEYKAKDNTMWKSTPFRRTRTPEANTFRPPANRIPNTGNAHTPVDVYNLFLSRNIILEIVACTNEEGRRQRGEQWKKTDFMEMEALFGVLLFIGAQKQSKASTEKIWTPLIGQDYVRATMGRNRYFELMNALRFDHKDSRRQRLQSDKLAHFRRIHEMHEQNLKTHYNPGAYLTVDEQLMPFRGRCSFIQYMPSKPAKYGLKLYWICDADNAYPLKSIPYIGKGSYEAGETETGLQHGGEVVTVLAHPWLEKGRNITTDNYFTDHELAEQLYEKKTTLVGTVRRNRKFVPKKFREKKHLKLHHSLFGFQKNKMLMSYQGKKKQNVILMSSMHDDEKVVGEEKKPTAIGFYNKTKGAVDTMDKLCLTFTCKRKTKRWPVVLMMNILDVSTVAALVIYRIKFPRDKLSGADYRGDFILEVAKALMMPEMIRRSEIPTLKRPLKVH